MYRLVLFFFAAVSAVFLIIRAETPHKQPIGVQNPEEVVRQLGSSSADEMKRAADMILADGIRYLSYLIRGIDDFRDLPQQGYSIVAPDDWVFVQWEKSEHRAHRLKVGEPEGVLHFSPKKVCDLIAILLTYISRNPPYNPDEIYNGGTYEQRIRSVIGWRRWYVNRLGYFYWDPTTKAVLFSNRDEWRKNPIDPYTRQPLGQQELVMLETERKKVLWLLQETEAKLDGSGDRLRNCPGSK